MKILALFPLKSELKAFLLAMEQLGQPYQVSQKNGRHLYEFSELKLSCALGGHGKAQFAIQAQHFLAAYPDFDSLICCGAGGGLCEDVKVGDVVLGETTLEHDYKEKFHAEELPPQFKADPQLLELFNAPKGIIASGDEDIVDMDRASELYEATKALAVAWEGAGGARAAQFNNKKFLEIRAITDNARQNVASDFTKNMRLAMFNLAKLMASALSD